MIHPLVKFTIVNIFPRIRVTWLKTESCFVLNELFGFQPGGRRNFRSFSGRVASRYHFMLDGQVVTTSSAVRKICSSSSSQDFSEDNYGVFY